LACAAVGKAEGPKAICRHNQGVEGNSIAMATAEQSIADGIMAMPAPFAVLAGFGLDF
jgi:hypothetical protein